MIKYSFIVPVYNTEKYLDKCITSLINQSFKDFEIIIINDGSPDNSNKIIEKYVLLNKNIKVINQSNKGLSEARNIGVTKAKGEYLLFIDSDDYVENDLLYTINIEIEDVDVLRFQVSKVIEETKEKINYNEVPFNTTEGYKSFKYLSKYHYVEPAWLYAIKRKYYVQNDFRFKKGVYHEDYGLLPYVIYNAKKVKSINYIGYNYVIRNESIMNNNDYSKTIKKAFDMLEQYKTLKLFSKNSNKKNNYDDYYLSYLSNSVIVKARELRKKEKKEYIKELKKINAFDGVLVNTKLRKFKKLFMSLNINLYLKVVK